MKVLKKAEQEPILPRNSVDYLIGFSEGYEAARAEDLAKLKAQEEACERLLAAVAKARL
ncbi:MAG: hypothetical protein AABY75_05560 [Bacteroidota bacterium]